MCESVERVARVDSEREIVLALAEKSNAKKQNTPKKICRETFLRTRMENGANDGRFDTRYDTTRHVMIGRDGFSKQCE